MKRYSRNSQSGNVLFYILIAIGLIALLTVAIRGNKSGSSSIDTEDAIIKMAQVSRFGQQVQEGIARVMANGVSEANIRFAHPLAHADYGDVSTTPSQQIFHPSGGNVAYLEPPEGINDGSDYEIYATTDIPQVGSAKADFILVLPNVTKAFCDAVNKAIGLDIVGTYPADLAGGTPTSIHGGTLWRYNAGNRLNGTPNTLDPATFSKKPITQGCLVYAGPVYHYFYVLMAR